MATDPSQTTDQPASDRWACPEPKFPTTKGASEGVTEADPWMKGYIAHDKGDTHSAPVWFLPSDQQAWLQGWRDAEQAYREAAGGN